MSTCKVIPFPGESVPEVQETPAAPQPREELGAVARSVIGDIQVYINRTGTRKKTVRYCMTEPEILTLNELSQKDAVEMMFLAFDYGKAKGYRAARAEARRG